jgi:hypothetical protein
VGAGEAVDEERRAAGRCGGQVWAAGKRAGCSPKHWHLQSYKIDLNQTGFMVRLTDYSHTGNLDLNMIGLRHPHQD